MTKDYMDKVTKFVQDKGWVNPGEEVSFLGGQPILEKYGLTPRQAFFLYLPRAKFKGTDPVVQDRFLKRRRLGSEGSENQPPTIFIKQGNTNNNINNNEIITVPPPIYLSNEIKNWDKQHIYE